MVRKRVVRTFGWLYIAIITPLAAIFLFQAFTDGREIALGDISASLGLLFLAAWLINVIKWRIASAKSTSADERPGMTLSEFRAGVYLFAIPMIGALTFAGTVVLFIFLVNWAPYAAGWTTRYAPGYSEKNFDRIQPGMTEREVETLLGQPLFPSQARSEAKSTWHYTRQRGNSLFGYETRWIDFTNGIVERKHKGIGD